MEKETILVHSCCASCASYVVEHLLERFRVIAFFYNPNIHPESEYRLRLSEMRYLCRLLDVLLITGDYDTKKWWDVIDPFKHLPERSPRCWACYRLRIEKTAELAVDLGVKRFTTTLSVSPHKVYPQIKKIGLELADVYGLRFHDEDFKKKDGFKKSVARSKELGFTRQDYCGCLLSLNESFERERRRKKSEGSGSSD